MGKGLNFQPVKELLTYKFSSPFPLGLTPHVLGLYL